MGNWLRDALPSALAINPLFKCLNRNPARTANQNRVNLSSHQQAIERAPVDRESPCHFVRGEEELADCERLRRRDRSSVCGFRWRRSVRLFCGLRLSGTPPLLNGDRFHCSHLFHFLPVIFGW